MRKLIGSFKGKICIIVENDYSQFNTIMNYYGESAGGDIDLLRDIFKKTNKDKSDQGLELFSAKAVYKEEINNLNNNDDDNKTNNNKWDENDIIESKRIVMENYLKSIQMELEFLRLKSEDYYIPIIFSIYDDQSDIDSIDQAANNVFRNFYRLIKYQMIDNLNIM